MAVNSESGAPPLRVWDLFVRLAHWTIVLAFLVTFVTEDDTLTLHVWAGYLIGVLVLLRVLWGFVGTKHARFADFVYGPAMVRNYLGDLARRRAKRYIGHSPAGGVMILVLLAGLLATVASGIQLQSVRERAAPPAASAMRAAVTQARGEDADERPRRQDVRFWKELHEMIANLMFVLILVHVGGVVVVSLLHRENLARAMVTGLKRAED